MKRFLKTALFFGLACGTMAFLACGDDPSGVQSTGDKEPSGKIDSTEIYNAFTDKRDGNVYRVVLIGNQAWMAEDLRYWDKNAEPFLINHSWCATTTERCKREGVLYDFAAVVGDAACKTELCDYDYPLRGICPEGWHLPNSDEWDELVSTANEMDISLDDFSPFASFATGEYDYFDLTTHTDECARYWTSTQYNSTSAYEYYRCSQSSSFKNQVYTKSFGYAVRCVADSVPKFDTYVEYVVPERTSSSSSSVEPQSSSSEKSVSNSCSSWESYVKDTTLNAFTDKRDGNVYRVYAIGSQVWMAENLRFHDEDASPALIGRHWEWESNEYLYSFGAVMDSADCETELCHIAYPYRGICPEGWHIPQSFEWRTLVSAAEGENVSLFDNYGFDAGWNYEYSAINRAVAVEGPDHRYARFWSVTQNSASGADEWYGDFNKDTGLKSQGYAKKFGYALRCVADSGEVKLDKHKDHLMSSSSVPQSSSSSTLEPEPKSSCDDTCNSSSSSSEPEPKSSCNYMTCGSSSSSTPEPAPTSSCDDTCNSSSSSSETVPMSSCDYTCNSSSSSSVPMSSCDYTCNSSSSSSDVSSSSKPVAIVLEPFVDMRDGNQYGAVQVEKLIWMTNNLRYADSAATPALKGNTACVADGCGKGNLYTYFAAVGNSGCATEMCFASYDAVQGICPDGWRLPTRNDWLTLDDKVRANKDILTALDFIPTGERDGNGKIKNDGYARFWLVNEDGSRSAYEGYNYVGASKMELQSYLKAFGYAVRCVQDVVEAGN